MPIKPCLHFVGFRDDEAERYQRAVQIFGRPAFVHPAWDTRAVADVTDEDTVVFAQAKDYDRYGTHRPVDFTQKARK